MALSLDAMFKPVNDFFLKKYQITDASQLLFRFDRYGTKISDEDYDADAHNIGEQFSDLVNRVPFLSEDGATVEFKEEKIDEYYHLNILKPSVPYLPKDVDEVTRESLLTTFASIKNRAIQDYENIYSFARGAGIVLEKTMSAPIAEVYRMSIPTPSNWYERTNSEIWDNCSLTITQEPDKTTDKFKVINPLWTLKLDDTQMSALLPALNTSEAINPKDLLCNINVSKRDALMHSKLTRTGIFDVVNPKSASMPLTTSAQSPLLQKRFALNPNAFRSNDVLQRLGTENNLAPQPRSIQQQNFHNAYSRLSLMNKIKLSNFIRDVAPARPVSTDTVTISFKYCLVRIDSRWLSTLFLNNPNWYVPGYKKGELSNGSTGLNILPNGMLAIKDLAIQANWRDDDLESINAATGFGPFNVDSSLDTSGNVRHAGIQIIGWLLQKMPDIPFNNPPPKDTSNTTLVSNST